MSFVVLCTVKMVGYVFIQKKYISTVHYSEKNADDNPLRSKIFKKSVILNIQNLGSMCKVVYNHLNIRVMVVPHHFQFGSI